MKTQRFTFARPGAITCLIVLTNCAMALAQNDKYACTEPPAVTSTPRVFSGEVHGMCGSGTAEAIILPPSID
jgi:hypothetical protein